MSKRGHFGRGFLAVAVWAGAVAAAPPAGLRMAIDGNSWSLWPMKIKMLVEEAGIAGHVDVSKEQKQRLENGEIDVVAYGHNGGASGEINGRVAALMEQGLKANPNLRMYYQASWVGEGTPGRVITAKDDYDTSKIEDLRAATDRLRKGHEDFADNLNKALGRRAVFVVPLGDAAVKLRAMIAEGKVPGVRRQSEIFQDAMPHSGVLLADLSGACHFAAIYRIPPPIGAAPPESADQATKDGHAQQAILRRIAWETVSEYPYAGIKETGSSGEAATGKAEPVATTGPATAGAVPAELKGWQATSLLDKAVITDYNDYIEALPPADRVGVADVRCFADATGQHAVAITVNGNEGARTHVLMYDKQNKRLNVSKSAPGTRR